MGFATTHLVETLLAQPLQIIVGNVVSAFGSYRTGLDVYDRAASKHKDLLVLDGVSHYELYDQPEPVSKAVTKLDEFYAKFLGK